jgi:hypothetical protein
LVDGLGWGFRTARKADVIPPQQGHGQNIVWLMNGRTVSTSAVLSDDPDTNWISARA